MNFHFYINDLIYTLILFGISFILLGLGFLLGNIFLNLEKDYFEKISSYECGFDSFNDAREPFDIKFYLIGILFIIFDVETILFFPWIFSIKELFFLGFFFILFFMFIVLLGFFYEWKKGCMDWE